jgi:hypothetical protein
MYAHLPGSWSLAFWATAIARGSPSSLTSMIARHGGGSAGHAGVAYEDRVFRNLRCKRVQVDEIWSFVYATAANVPHSQVCAD